MVTVRPWAFSDIPQIASIMADHTLWQHYGVTAENATVRLARLFSEGEDGFVAQDGDPGIVAGFVLYNCKTFGEAGYIRLLGVAPHCTSQGLGAQLLARVEEKLGEADTHRLLLLCTEWNYRAQNFYRRQGFTIVGRLPDWTQIGTAEILFVKYLKP
jgi:ribosomal protein S18 acetylase RimI-like enzyme